MTKQKRYLLKIICNIDDKIKIKKMLKKMLINSNEVLVGCCCQLWGGYKITIVNLTACLSKKIQNIIKENFKDPAVIRKVFND
ncbi:MAG: hypothetical protein RR478_04535 [Bacilli bacterium]